MILIFSTEYDNVSNQKYWVAEIDFLLYKEIMTTFPTELLSTYRRQTFRILPGLHLKNREESVDFVNEHGFVYFWPIKGILLPSLWAAVAGDRLVADAHDDPGHVTWGWKDSLLGKRIWYYGKVLRKKATIISLETVPYFYALSENYGAPEEDYLTLYEQGRLTQEAKAIYEALLSKGVLDTVALRKATHMTSTESDTRFERALVNLQTDFKILPVGVTDSGAWKYAFAYDIVARHFPELQEQAQQIQERQARAHLIDLYLRSVGAAQLRDISRLFGWQPVEIEAALTTLTREKIIFPGIEIENETGEWFAHAKMIRD
jgi:hypothetical protein